MLDIIKQLAADAVDLGRATDFCMGTVVSGSPLRIRLEEGLELTEPFLILAEPVTNWQETGTVWLWRDEEERSRIASSSSSVPRTCPSSLSIFHVRLGS